MKEEYYCGDGRETPRRGSPVSYSLLRGFMWEGIILRQLNRRQVHTSSTCLALHKFPPNSALYFQFLSLSILHPGVKVIVIKWKSDLSLCSLTAPSGESPTP